MYLKYWLALIIPLFLLIPSSEAQEVPQIPEDHPFTAEEVFGNGLQSLVKQVIDCEGQEGMDKLIQEMYGREPIHYAAAHDDILEVKLQLLDGADIDAQDGVGSTPVSLAARYGHAELTRILLEMGANPEIEDQYGMNAYDHALEEGEQEIAELLTPFIQK